VGVMEQGVRAAGDIANIVCFGVWLQQIILIAGKCVNRNGMETFGLLVSGVKCGG
jgi:hypothetical protein